MLAQQVVERFVGEFLKGRHPVGCQVLKCGQRLVVEMDHLARHRGRR